MKQYDKDFIWTNNAQYPNSIELHRNVDGVSTAYASIYTLPPYFHTWKIADDTSCSDQLSFLFYSNIDRTVHYPSKFSAMKAVMHKINEYIKRFNPEGISNKVYYIDVHQNEHMSYATTKYFSYK